jgi:prepilin-type processing-associated H-X9-DG protein
MKVRLSERRNEGLTRADVIALLVIVAVLAVLAAMLLPVLAAAKRRSSRINCISNLNQLSVSYQVCQLDPELQMSVLVTNGNAVERLWEEGNSTNASVSAADEIRRGPLLNGNAAGWFQVMSNQLSTPKILICPADTGRTTATNFTTDFNNSHISYFVNPDANKTYPQMLLFGDSNLQMSNAPVKPGLLTWTGNTPLSWTAARHKHVGNISYADGSVAEISDNGLQQAFLLATNGTPTMTDRLMIP